MYGAKVENDSADFSWKSTKEEKELYSAITMRIQKALENLENEAKIELGSKFPERPYVVQNGEWRGKT
eukprot:CAMPEP_0171465404 /NCGR_PEP_ID=MMETSP0945-20130129/8476_1 /TAXON_ID=109269 /ORGANISM="Vaucheria litorea, Strain CCMP2940" /LENGTH=67 /DNA_ID=CAMNT_0011992965 /DNA_START=6 /DNA_END=205 /DNA_ORIENTATION=-